MEALPSAYPTDQATISQAEDRVSVAPNWKLVWWRFRKNKLAVVSAVVLIIFYAVVFFPDFFATLPPHETSAKQAFIPPQRIAFFRDGYFMSVPAVEGKRNKVTLRMEWTVNPDKRIGIQLIRPRLSLQSAGPVHDEHPSLWACGPG